jgi:hypothetical protein
MQKLIMIFIFAFSCGLNAVEIRDLSNTEIDFKVNRIEKLDKGWSPYFKTLLSKTERAIVNNTGSDLHLNHQLPASDSCTSSIKGKKVERSRLRESGIGLYIHTLETIIKLKVGENQRIVDLYFDGKYSIVVLYCE